METATFGGGCFWCTEAIFKRIKGIVSVMSGYAGGHMDNPTYKDVTTGKTGHAESIQITFDPGIVPYDKLLEIFFATHDPTTEDRQGTDIGTQYRSVIFYHNDKQKYAVESMIQKIEKEGLYKNPVLTQLLPFKNFYKAEDYHQNFYDSNKNYPYCQIVINPKIKKLLKEFKSEIKQAA